MQRLEGNMGQVPYTKLKASTLSPSRKKRKKSPVVKILYDLQMLSQCSYPFTACNSINSHGIGCLLRKAVGKPRGRKS